MSLINEVVFSCDGSGAISVWEPKGGTLLMSYKGAGVLNPQALCLLGNDYVLGVEKGKPMIHAWPINSQEKAQLRMICPGRVSSMQASPDAVYIAVSVETKLHIWQISSGRLLATANSHYQPITVVKWSADSNFIVTGGEDGNVIVWQLSRLVCKQTVAFGIPGTTSRGASGLCEPLHVKSQHSLPVTSLVASKFNAKSRVASVSHDRTCKIFDLVSGEDLLTFVMDTRLTCVAFDLTEDNVYMGTSEGHIKSVSLRQVPRTRDHHVQNSTSADFFGHEKQVTSLSVSITGVVLISTALDETLKIWHTVSRQCLRTIVHKGAVLGAFLSLAPSAIHDHDFNPKVLLKSFDKSIEVNSDLIIEINSTTSLSCDILKRLNRNTTSQTLCSSQEEIQTVSNEESDSNERVPYSMGVTGASQIEVDKLKKINRALYEYCVTNILHGNREFEKVNAKLKDKRKLVSLSLGKYRERSQEDRDYQRQKTMQLGEATNPKGQKIAHIEQKMRPKGRETRSKGQKIKSSGQKTGQNLKAQSQNMKTLGFKGRKKLKKNSVSKLNFQNTKPRMSVLGDILKL